MTQKEKDLLLKDLCTRLPYGVKVQTTYINKETKERKDIGTDILGTVEISLLIEGCEEHKPCLFPLSSITDEQIYQSPFGYATMDTIRQDEVWSTITIGCKEYYDIVDWLNKNHFDYRGLIEKGLAIDATGKNIY